MKRIVLAPALVALSCALAWAAPLSKQEKAKLKGEAQMALKYALTAQAMKARAQRSGDTEAVMDQEQIEEEQFRKIPPLLDQLCEANDKKTWRFICKIADKMPEHYDCHEVVLKAVTTMTDPGVQADAKRACLKFKSPKIRRAMVLHMANQKEWGVLLKAMKDKDEQVAALAAWRLIDNKVESAVVPMIDYLEKIERERDGIWDVLRNGLGRMLGKRCGSAIEYRSLWTIVQEEGGLAKVHPEEEKKAAPGELSSGVRLFGREIDCTRVVFILDVSGSMEQIDPNQQLYDDGGGSRVRDAGDSEGKKESRLKTRLQRAQRQLKNVINRLPANFKINIVAYSSRNQIWRGEDGDKPAGLHPLTKANRKAACEFVDKFRADGVTATDSALQRAFAVEGARCFYLLSDGFATADGRTKIPTEQIIGVIDDNNAERHVIVHTLGFQGADVDMMQQVAKHTGGRYSDIK